MRISNSKEFWLAEGESELADIAQVKLAPESAPLVGANDSGEFEQSLIVDRPAARRVASSDDSADPATGSGVSFSRILDCIVAAAALVILLPVIAAIYLALKISDNGPAFFPHRRVGLGGRTFACLKFRTMCIDADARLERVLAQDEAMLSEWNSTRKLLRDPRVTPLGRFLRNTSLDELPQLFNVLRGDMGLVGPRPIVRDELDRYGRFAAHYTSVRPGLTGLWQVTRSEDTTYNRRVATDVFYVRNRSVAFDCRIMLATIPAVLGGNN